MHLRLTAIVGPRRTSRQGSVAGRALVLLASAAMAASVLVACSDGGSAAESPAIEGATCADRLAPDDERAAALAERWLERPGFEDLYASTPLTPQPLFRCIRPDEYGQVISSCMNEEGFATELTPDGEGVSWAGIPQDQMTAAYRAGDLCALRYPVDPIYSMPLDEDQLSQLHRHLLDVTIPCLRGEGHPVADPPSLQVFTERWNTPSSYSPFTELVEAGVDIEPLLEVCPERPSIDEMWPR